MKRIMFFTVLYIFASVKAFTQPANWVVNFGDFQHGMNVTALANIDGVISDDPLDKVAAFVNDECRGVAPLQEVLDMDGSGSVYLAFLSVFSNVTSGETIEIRFYDKSSEEVINLTQTLPFENGKTYGTPSEPYPLYTNLENINISLNSLGFDENISPLTEIAIISSEIGNMESGVSFSLPDTLDNARFMIEGNVLKNLDEVNFEVNPVFNITVQLMDATSGITGRNTFEINVNDLNEKPEIITQNIYFPRSIELGDTIGVINFDDEDKINGQSHVFTITNQPLNIFVINSEGVVFLKEFANIDFSGAFSTTIVVKVEDTGEPVLSDTRTIVIEPEISSVLEPEFYNYFSPNDDGINDTWTIRNIHLISDYNLKIFSPTGNMVYESEQYDNDAAWDGTKNGSKLSESSYYYILRTTKKEYKGYITLVR